MRVKMSKQPPPAPTASAIGPCPTVIKIVGRPGTGSLPSTIAPPDHPTLHQKIIHLITFVEARKKRYTERMTNAKTFCSQKHTFLKTSWSNISQSFGVPNFFFAYLLSKSQSGSRWLVGCFGFNGPLSQYFNLYRAFSQREGEREEKRIDESKNVQTTPTRTYYKHSRPLPYCNPNCRTPRHWKFTQHHRTTRPPPNQGVSGGEVVDTNVAYAMGEERRHKVGGDTDT